MKMMESARRRSHIGRKTETKTKRQGQTRMSTPPTDASRGTVPRGGEAGRIGGVFRRLRQLEISLAKKCQLLFGAAVVLILAAALFVPWLRMELLTDQINERSARAMAESAKAQH